MVNILKNGYYKTKGKISILGIKFKMGLPSWQAKREEILRTQRRNNENCRKVTLITGTALESRYIGRVFNLWNQSTNSTETKMLKAPSVFWVGPPFHNRVGGGTGKWNGFRR